MGLARVTSDSSTDSCAPHPRPGELWPGPGRVRGVAVPARQAREDVHSQWLPAHRRVHVRRARCPGHRISPASAATVFARAVARGLRAPLLPGAWGPARPAAGRGCRSEHPAGFREGRRLPEPRSSPQRPRGPCCSSHPFRLPSVEPGVHWGGLALCDFLSQRIRMLRKLTPLTKPASVSDQD